MECLSNFKLLMCLGQRGQERRDNEAENPEAEVEGVTDVEGTHFDTSLSVEAMIKTQNIIRSVSKRKSKSSGKPVIEEN